MRKFCMIVCSLTAIVTFAPQLRADDSTGAAAIAAILANSPGCGPELRSALTRAIEVDPSLAKSAVGAAASASPCQQQEIYQAMSDAADFFAKIGTLWAQAALGVIESAAAASPFGSTIVGPNLVSPMPRDPPALAVSRCVSPSHPPGSCS